MRSRVELVLGIDGAVKMPATIDDPAILDEIRGSLAELGYPAA